MLDKRVGAARWMFAASLLVVLAGCSSGKSETASSLPEVTPETEVLPGKSYVLRVGTHCGVERLGLPVNDVFWITDEGDATSTDWLPTEWTGDVDGGLIPLKVVLSADGSELQAEASDRKVTYRQVDDSDEEVFCG